MRLLAITNCFPRSFQDTAAPWNRQQFLTLATQHRIRLIVPVPFTQQLTAGPSDPLCWSSEDDFQAFYPRFWFTPRCLQHHYGSFMFRSIQTSLKHALDNFKPDAVLGCWAHPDGYSAVKIARRLGVPALVKVVGSDVLVLSKDKARRQVIADTLRRADGVFAVSRDLADHVIELGVDAAKVHVIPEGVDKSLFTPGDQAAARVKRNIPVNGKVLLFVGNLLLSKGAGVLLKACRLLLNEKTDFTCYLLGRGKEQASLKQLAKQLNLGRHVIFAPPCPLPDLPDWYRAADLVTLPSFSEGIPNTLREALCCGVPFVATNAGGIPEISSPSFSRLVSPGAVEELAAALKQMLASPPKVDPAVVNKLCISWDQSAAMVGKLLQSLRAAHTTGPGIKEQNSTRFQSTIAAGPMPETVS